MISTEDCVAERRMKTFSIVDRMTVPRSLGANSPK